MPENRTKTGRFVKGQSGNPGGRPKVNPEYLEALRAVGPEMVQKLIAYTDNENAKIAMWAITEILDRAYGKPTQAQDIQITGDFDLRAQVRNFLMERQNGRAGNRENSEQ